MNAQRRNMSKLGFTRVIANVLLSIFSIDLLFLYYDHPWYEPSRFIEITEITLLFFIGIMGVALCVKELNQNRTNKD